MSEDDYHTSGLAKHTLFLESGGVIKPDTDMPAKPAGSPYSAVQRQPIQGSAEPESPRLAPRAKAIREQGFSDQVATRIEAPQRRSTRFVFEAMWL